MRRLLKQNCWSQRVGSVAEDATQRRGQRCRNHPGMAEPGEETLELRKRNVRFLPGLPGNDSFGFQSDGNNHDDNLVYEHEKTNDQNCANDHRRERSGVRNRSVELPGFARKILLTPQSPCLSLVVIDVVAEQDSKQENGKGPSK